MTSEHDEHSERMTRSAGLDSFERELLTELRTAVDARTTSGASGPRHAVSTRGRRRYRAAALTGTAAAVGLAGGSLLWSGPAAFAVDATPDGAVVIRIHELEDESALESALAERGVQAVVDYSGTGTQLVVDEQGNVTLDDARRPAVDAVLAPFDPTPMDATFTDDTTSSCGLDAAGELPVTLQRDGQDYLVTLAEPAVTDSGALRISTATGTLGDTLVVTYRFGTATCGAMLTR